MSSLIFLGFSFLIGEVRIIIVSPNNTLSLCIHILDLVHSVCALTLGSLLSGVFSCPSSLLKQRTVVIMPASWELVASHEAQKT